MKECLYGIPREGKDFFEEIKKCLLPTKNHRKETTSQIRSISSSNITYYYEKTAKIRASQLCGSKKITCGQETQEVKSRVKRCPGSK